VTRRWRSKRKEKRSRAKEKKREEERSLDYATARATPRGERENAAASLPPAAGKRDDSKDSAGKKTEGRGGISKEEKEVKE